MRDLILRLGEEWRPEFGDDFGEDLDDADRIADFFNNGGLEFHNNGVNYALVYAAVFGDDVKIGAWAWMDGEDFDEDATFEIYEEDDFSGGELKAITDKIKEIYGRAS